MGEEPKQLEPGRALDRVIAEKMGFKYIPEGKGGWPEHIEFADQPGHFVELPDYSTQMNDAWQVVEYILNARPTWVSVSSHGASWTCHYEVKDEKNPLVSHGNGLRATTAPHAICLAFLAWEREP